MTITIEAIYENGVLRPVAPLPLLDHEKVQVTIHTPIARQPPIETAATSDAVGKMAGLIPCSDALLIERIALDPALEYGEIE